MHSFELVMPAVFEVAEDDKERLGPKEEWTQWGWCNADELTYGIWRRYNDEQIRWSAEELFRRFPWSPTRHTPLRALMIMTCQQSGAGGRLEYQVVPLSEFDRPKDGRAIYVPSGWARAVLRSMIQGGRRALVIGGEPIPQVCAEDGQRLPLGNFLL